MNVKNMVLLKIFFLLFLFVSCLCKTVAGDRNVNCISRGQLPFQPATSVLHNTQYLYFTNERVSSATAFCRCRGWNAVLLQIKNETIQRHIEQNMPSLKDCRQNSPHGFYYIGLYRVNGRWLWPDNTTPRNYNNWYIRSSGSPCNEPNGYNAACFKQNQNEYRQDSVQIFACSGKKRGKWYDKRDNSQWNYICERPAPPASRTMADTTITASTRTATTTTARVTSNATNFTYSAELFQTNKVLADRQASFSSTSSPQTTSIDASSRAPSVSSTTNLETIDSTVSSFENSSVSVGSASYSASSLTPHSSSVLNSSSEALRTLSLLSSTSSTSTIIANNQNGKAHRRSVDDCISRLLKNQTWNMDEDCEFVYSRFSRNFDIRDWECNLSKSVARVMLTEPRNQYFIFRRFSGIKLQLYKISLKNELSQAFSQNYNGNTEDFWITFDKVRLNNHVLVKKEDLENLPFPITIVAAEIQSSLWTNNNISSATPASPVDSIQNSNKKLELNKRFHILPPNSSILSLSVFVEDDEKNLVKRNVSSKTVIDLKLTNDFFKQVERQSGRTIPSHAISHVCSFLETGRQLKWSEEGCGLINIDHQTVSCGCNHTTSFGVILAIRTINIPPAVSILFVALESISIIALALTLTLLLWLKKKIRNDRTWVQINLALSLLLLHFSFLFGGSDFAKINQRLCESFSVLTHFFTLSSAMWMLNEGIVLFFKTSKQTLSFDMKKCLPFLVLLAWGLPVFVVSVSAGIGFSSGTYMDRRVNPENDIQPNEPVYNRCLVGTENKMIIYAIFIPLAVIFCFTTSILIVVTVEIFKMSKNMKKMKPTGSCRRKTNTDANKNAVDVKDIRKKKLKQVTSFAISRKHASAALRALLLLLPVLGIPWILGFFVNIKKAEEIFLIIHGVVNGLQGVFIFYIYCVKNSQFRRSFSQKLSQYSTKKDLNSGNSSKFTRGFSQSGSHPKRKT